MSRGTSSRPIGSARPFNIGMKRQAPDVPKKRGVWIDHETGLIHGLPEGPQPLVGPTSGKAYEDLKKAEAKNRSGETDHATPDAVKLQVRPVQTHLAGEAGPRPVR